MPEEQAPTTTEATTTSSESTLSAGLTASATESPEAAPVVAEVAAKDSTKSDALVPEKYDAWTVPEGYELDAGLVDEASPIFKELGLTQEASQKLVDFYAKHALKSSDDAMKAWMETRSEWREDMKSDPVLGKLVGKDGNFGPDSPLVRTINRALDGLQNPKLVSDFKAAMNLTGGGDNPAFVQVLHALASKVTEGTSYASGSPTNIDPKTGQVRGRPSAGAALYPSLPSASGAG
jgi:hypothetical protein